VATIMVDIDKFKSINDTYGHHVGDEVICEVAHRLGSWLRTGDIVCRYGGEEFAILLPDADPGIAEAVAQRICTGIAAEPVSTQAGPLPVTVSAGVADAIADGATMQSMLSRADAALYRAKRAGRNRVISDFGDRPST